MRVLLDITPVTRAITARTGLARVAYSLAHALHERSDLEVECIGWGSVAATFEVGRFLAEQSTLHAAPVQPSALLRAYDRAYRRQARPPRWLIRLGQALNKLRDPLRGLDPSRYDVVHSTYAGIPRGARRWRRPKVITVHDLTPLRLAPALIPAEQVAITRRVLGSIRPANWVACVSEHTRRDFLETCAHPPERTVVIPNGVEHERFHPVNEVARLETVRARFGLGSAPFVLSLSSLAPHKNLRMLVEIWPEIRRRWPTLRLALAGGKGADASALMRGLGLAGPPPAGLVLTGFVPDEDLPSLFSAAELFVFPSLYEGFGLPVLEAMACGVPVVAARSSSIPEVVGPSSTLVSPTDRNAWIEAIVGRLETGVRCSPDISATSQAAGFSWARAAADYVDLYENAWRQSR